ncbi:hypothetical protein K458DRAFT_392930 [Lentithecium fluviatile CBS 122367]|uniref:Uncharacterized protein n=1 Tax=Lentithecium fluviatile CBS 122367 TaxID=1168545 RepID=A0A6G1IQL8_9PLEO|nr:hypothetical protein K458DRAFT_392930 [Lentithecium fluviatile CBS 122367]
MTDTLLASIRYVVKDPKTAPGEKGCILHYAAPSGFSQNNFSIQPYSNIKMRNLCTANLTYEDHGLIIASIDSSQMRPSDFDDDDWIEKAYLPELHGGICKSLGAKDVTVFDWMLRKRARSFPQRHVSEENEGES